MLQPKRLHSLVSKNVAPIGAQSRSGNIPCSRQSIRSGFCAGTSARQRRRLVNTTIGLLQLVASIVAGLLWDQIGHTAVFYYGAAFAVVGSIGLYLLYPDSARIRRPPLPNGAIRILPNG